MTLREQIANALEEAFEIKRRNQTFILNVRRAGLRDNNNEDVFVETASREPVKALKPHHFTHYKGMWIYKQHYKANKEKYLDQIMLFV